MSTAVKKMTYPYITSNPGISGGAAIIEGTRITVRIISGYYQMGMDVDEIMSTLPHLTASQIHSALGYYFDHQQEIDSELAENSDWEYWKTQVKQHPKQGA